MLAYLWADGDTQDRPELILARTRTPVVALQQTVAEGEDRPILGRGGLAGPN
jgi:hypothetical protein